LVLLNDPVYVGAAKSLAARAIAESESAEFPDRLDYLFRLTLNRAPTAEEHDRFLAFHRDVLAATGDEAASWYQLATVLLNLDETICIE
jgi:hypothetical protein